MVFPGERYAQHVVIGVHVQFQMVAGPEHRWDGQVEDKQEKRKGPACGAQGAGIQILREGHMELPGQQKRRREGEKQQGEPGSDVHGLIKGADCLRVPRKPISKGGRASEYAEDSVQAHQHQCSQLDE